MAATLTFDILAKDRASSTLTRVGGAAEKTSKKFTGLKTAAVTAGIAVGVFAVKFAKDSVKAFTEAEKSTTQLQDAFSRFPKLADSSITAFQKLNTELQKKTKFDDEAYASGQAVLAQFGLTGKQILAVTPLLGDYAAKTGKDVPTAAKLLGKASLGNARALKDLGINFKATGDQSKDMATVIGLVRERVGGFAAKEGKTASGQAAILSNQFQELQETVGSKLVPVLLKLAGVALKIVDFMQRNSKVIGPLVAIVAGLATVIWLVVKAQAAWNAVAALNPIGLIVIAVAALAIGAVVAYKKFKPFRDIVDAVFRFIKNNWPLLLGIITGPIGLAAIAIIKNFKKIKETARTVFLFIANIFLDMIEGMLGALGKLLGAFAHLPGPLGKPFRKARDAVNDAKKSVEDFQRKINATHGKTIKITAKMAMANRLKIATQQGVSLTISGKPIPLAAGGLVRGPGGPVGDKIPARLSDGEYVIKASRARKLGTRFLDVLNGARSIGGDPAGMTVGFAGGGAVRTRAFVRAQGTDPYIWGGFGPNGFDCSGLVGAAAAVARGIANPFQRFMTTASNFAALGWKRGVGAFTMGVNPYTHMAGNAFGLPFEAASTRSGIHVGTGAQSVMRFAQQWHLPQFGNVFGGMGSVNLGARDLRKLMRAISINWGVPSAGRTLSFDRGGWLPPGRSMAVNNTGRSERVGPVDLSDRTINKLAQVLLAGIGASSVASARRADLYART